MRPPTALLIALLATVAALRLPAAPAGPAATPPAPTIRIGVESEPGDRRFDFPAELLEAALEASGAEARVERVRGLTQPRMAQAVREGRLDVVALPSLRAPSPGLLGVRFPLRRGLLGVRVLLARPDRTEALAAVASLDALKRGFTKGYGHDWMDRAEMAALGFRIETGSSYRGLFDMLRGGRFDYLSRGVSELQAELGDPALAGSGLVVVPRIALFYPLDDFFFVGEDNARLAADIERGLRVMLANGRYNALLEQHYGDAMRAARIDERTVLHVVDYPVPDGTPLTRFDILEPVRSQAIFRDPTAR